MADGSGNAEYAAAQSAAASQGGAVQDGGCAVCHTGNWVHVRYEYVEGDPVTDATFIVQTPNGGVPGGTVLHEGVLSIGPDQPGYIHVDLGAHDGPVEVFFFDDPVEPEAFEEPAPVADERAWYERAADAVVGAVEWTGEVAMGDFNEEMTTGQIVTNALVTAVPVVDQVADARDLIANGKALIWDRRYNEIAVWVGVFSCLIGLFPSLGSLAKGVIKLVWKNAGEVGRLLVYINRAFHRTGLSEINGYRFLRKIADEIPGMVDAVKAKFDEFLDACAARAARLRMTQTLATIEHVRAMAREKFAQVAAEISARITRGLARFATPAWRMFPGQSIVVRRATVIARQTYESWQDTMVRVGFDKTALEAGAEPLDDATDAFRKAAGIRAARWRDELLADPQLPPSLRSFLEENPGGQALSILETFSERPQAFDFTSNPTTLYRVIDRPSGIGGGFWSRAEPPSDEATWRSRDAVRNTWNEGGAFVSATVPPPPAGLVGPIAPQVSEADTSMMLRGGGEQVFIPGRPAVPETQVEQYFHTDWNDRAPVAATRATSQAGRTGECDL